LGNKNNYLREEECILACRGVQGGPLRGSSGAQATFPQGPSMERRHPDTSGFDELQRIHFPSDKGHCVDLPDTGLCKESIPRWYYNPFSEHCARFTYGGCYGNKNNFEEEQQCLESCRGISKKDVFGLRREIPIPSTGSVEMAVAVFLVICIVVVVAILGYCFFKNQRKDFHGHHHHPPPTPASSTVSTTEDTEHLVYNHTTRP
ncbi:SPINT1 isoform 8, partial [Pan troglodytes]